MANDYLVSKWKMWFSWFDHNKDGKVCAEDLETSRNRFANLSHLTAQKRQTAMDKYTQWWSEYLMWGQPEITEAEFVEKQKKAYESDKQKFINRMKENEELVCNLMDTDGDGMIIEEDHMAMFKSTMHNDEVVDHKWWNAYGPVDGKITVKKLVDFWFGLLTCDDSSKPDVLVQLFQAGL